MALSLATLTTVVTGHVTRRVRERSDTLKQLFENMSEKVFVLESMVEEALGPKLPLGQVFPML